MVYRINGGTVTRPGDSVASATFGNNPTDTSSMTPATLKTLLDAGTAVTLQANNDITLQSALTVDNANGNGGALTLLAGRNININAALTTDNGNFTAVAGSKHADLVSANTLVGYPTLTMGPAGSINAGTGTVNLSTTFFDNQNTSAQSITAGVANLYLPYLNGDNGGWTYFKPGGQTPDGKRYGIRFDESTVVGTCEVGCALPTSGFNVLYEALPTLEVAPNTGQTMVYGNTYAPGGYTLSGFVDGDTESTAGISGTAQYVVNLVGKGTTGSNHLPAGTWNVVYTSGLASSLGYRVQQKMNPPGGELTITPIALSSVTGITASDKTYNGTTAATIDVSNASLTGLLANDQAALSTAGATGSFADKNVGQNKTVTVNGLALTGLDADNYTFSGVTTTASITPASISQVSGITANNKTYDGTVNATLNTDAMVLTGKVSGDNLSLATSYGRFVDKNVGQGKTVYIENLSLVGADAGNYILSSPSNTATANISPATISSITGLTGVDRTANGRTAVDLDSSSASFNGVVAGDQLTIGAYNANFADVLPAKNKPVAITELRLGGADAGNYTLLETTATTTATMKPSGDPQIDGAILPPGGSGGGGGSPPPLDPTTTTNPDPNDPKNKKKP